MATLEQQLMALVRTGQLDPRTANLLKSALTDGNPDERMSETALRIVEDRIRGKVLLYFRDLAQRAADGEGVTEEGK